VPDYGEVRLGLRIGETVSAAAKMKTSREGGCHCKGVRFKVNSTFESALLCDCSICKKFAFLHLIVPRDDFKLLKGENDLTSYKFGTGMANHLFCRVCGVKSFYIPRSHPNGYSVNLRCVDDVDLSTVKVMPFDGQNWEVGIEKIPKQ
jgi:hypothetical protein